MNLTEKEKMTKKTLSKEIIGCKSCLGEWIPSEKVRRFVKLVIEKDLEMCKVCGGSHGKWLDKEDFLRRFKKRLGGKLTKS